MYALDKMLAKVLGNSTGSVEASGFQLIKFYEV